LPGKVLRLSPQMDPRTHTFRVEVEVENPDGLLKPGMFIQASIVSERRENVATIPREAVAKRAGRDVAFVIDGQRAVMRIVRLGVRERLSIEIRDGVTAGERVAVRGLETLTDGTRVRVITP
jgi:RND family efflux transporter MFP subunit